MQELDAANKREAASKDTSHVLIPSKDFADQNCFSYIYSTKVHKSHAMREMNDKR